MVRITRRAQRHRTGSHALLMATTVCLVLTLGSFPTRATPILPDPTDPHALASDTGLRLVEPNRVQAGA